MAWNKIRLTCSVAVAVPLLASVGLGSASVQWSGELHNLDYTALDEGEVEQLRTVYAQDVAEALGLKPVDVRDVHGNPGRVSLGSPEDPALIFGSTSKGALTTPEITTTTTTSSSTTTTTTTTTSTTSTTSTTVAASPMSPLRGIAYGALPCKNQGCRKTGRAPEDMLQEAYSKQWGADGRDDLGTIARIGANAVRLYHALGMNVEQNHGGFLDRAQDLGLNVMPGYHTELVHTGCPGFDCYKAWKDATLQGFKFGFRQGNNWHNSISALILLNEPDFFGSDPMCNPSGAWCRVKALLSALDGVLAAEREAGVKAGRVKLTVTWSFGQMASIDGKVNAPGLFGFQDTVAGIADPSIAHYTPRSSQAELEHAFRTRWVHGMNTQAPWSFVKDVIGRQYAQFSPIGWFIGEYGANGQPASTIQSDLEDMQRTAEENGDFLGAAFFQFQTAHFKGGAELNFGLFRLGSEKIGEIEPPCHSELHRCPSPWPVYCLSSDLSWLPGTLGDRAQAVAAAWHGSLEGNRGFCTDDGSRRLSTMRTLTAAKSTRVACIIDTSGNVSAREVDEKLQEQEFIAELAGSSKVVLGNSSGAILGGITLVDAFAIAQGRRALLFEYWFPLVLVALLLAAGGLAFCVVKKKKVGQLDSNASGTSAV